MRSTSRGSKKKYPEKYADPLGVEDVSPAADLPWEMLPVRTGLSEEEDAGRFIVEEFNPDAMWCTRCEMLFIAEIRCKHCNRTLLTKSQRDRYNRARRRQ